MQAAPVASGRRGWTGLAAALLLAAPAAGQDTGPPSDPWLARDAAAYAALAGVDAAEGERRLRWQEGSVAVTDALRREWAGRLAGIAVAQRPDWHLVVRLAGAAPVPDRLVGVGGAAVRVEFAVGAPATLAALTAALVGGQAAIRAALAHPPGLGIDQRAGTLVAVVAAADLDTEGPDALAARLSDVAGVPVRVRSIDRPGFDAAGAVGGQDDGAAPAAPAVIGGARLLGGAAGAGRRWVCTAGWAVTDGARDAVATAAHCADELAWVGPDGRERALPFLDQRGWGHQDVQLNLADGPLAPAFRADGGEPRPVLATRDAAGLRAGDVVCHQGVRTGYACAAVELTSFAPAGDLCGGPCLPTWVSVAGPACGGGDSGAPVFVGATALGIVKGGSYRADGSCGFSFFMPIAYLPAGWSVKLARPS